MSIPNLLIKIKAHETELWLILVVSLVGTGAYGLGRLSALRAAREPVRVESTPPTPVSIANEKMYVASKTGKKFHLPWCAGATQIKEENKVWFATKDQAAAAGYAPAGNCPGI